MIVVISSFSKSLIFKMFTVDPGWGGGVRVLPYMGYIGMCGPKGYGFQPFWF